MRAFVTVVMRLRKKQTVVRAVYMGDGFRDKKQIFLCAPGEEINAIMHFLLYVLDKVKQKDINQFSLFGLSPLETNCPSSDKHRRSLFIVYLAKVLYAAK